jgi:hypothetical protein
VPNQPPPPVPTPPPVPSPGGPRLPDLPAPPTNPPAIEPPHPPTVTPDAPTTVVVQLPDDLINRLSGSSTSWWLSALSGFGVGAILAAAISGIVLYFIERKRQQGENTRKRMELKRTDQRRWDQEIREAFTDVRGELASMRTIVGNTRLAAHWSNNEDEMLRNYQKVEAIRAHLGAIADSLRVVADDNLIQKFNATTDLATDFAKQFGVKDGRVAYTVETVRATAVPPFPRSRRRSSSRSKTLSRLPMTGRLDPS